MTSRTAKAIRGVGAGLAAGAILGVASSYAMNNKKSLSKKGHKALRAVTGILDDMQGMF